MQKDLMDNFLACTWHYIVNWGKNQTDSTRQLLMHMYVWALCQYMGGEAHWIHRHLLLLSFLWAAFAKGIAD